MIDYLKMVNLMSKLYYLGQPYSHKNPDVMHQRFIDGCKAEAQLVLQGFHIYGPIPETVSVATYGKLEGTGWLQWREQDLDKLNRCDVLLILLLEGWQDSQGLRGEIKFALQNHKEIKTVRFFKDDRLFKDGKLNE